MLLQIGFLQFGNNHGLGNALFWKDYCWRRAENAVKSSLVPRLFSKGERWLWHEIQTSVHLLGSRMQDFGKALLNASRLARKDLCLVTQEHTHLTDRQSFV